MTTGASQIRWPTYSLSHPSTPSRALPAPSARPTRWRNGWPVLCAGWTAARLRATSRSKRRCEMAGKALTSAHRRPEMKPLRKETAPMRCVLGFVAGKPDVSDSLGCVIRTWANAAPWGSRGSSESYEKLNWLKLSCKKYCHLKSSGMCREQLFSLHTLSSFN